MMRVCWAVGPGSGNAGDLVTPYMLEWADIEHVRVKSTDGDKHLMCGSIMVWSQDGDTVWGTGNSHASMKGKIGSNLKVLAVRGPLTRQLLIEAGQDCPEVYGDPALLLPKFYRPSGEKRYKLGVVPHYIDWEGATLPQELHLINPIQPVATFIDSICECENIVSSSLHGLIIAHAYGVPARWVAFSDKVFGDGLKFRDYLLSVGHDLYDPVWPKDDDFRPADLDIDIEKLWEVRPWT